MPTAPARLCARCRNAVPAGQRCPTCDKPWSTSTRPGSTRRSRKRRRQRLRRQPICAWPGCTALAVEDDHIIPWTERGDMTFEQWDADDNHQGLCEDHHREKTQAEARRHR